MRRSACDAQSLQLRGRLYQGRAIRCQLLQSIRAERKQFERALLVDGDLRAEAEEVASRRGCHLICHIEVDFSAAETRISPGIVS